MIGKVKGEEKGGGKQGVILSLAVFSPMHIKTCACRKIFNQEEKGRLFVLMRVILEKTQYCENTKMD